MKRFFPLIVLLTLLSMQSLWGQITLPDTGSINIPTTPGIPIPPIPDNTVPSQTQTVDQGDEDWHRVVVRGLDVSGREYTNRFMYSAPNLSRVGIGTTNPGTFLDITGPNRQLQLTDSDDGHFWQLSASSNALAFRYQEGAPNERLALWLNSSGNVGIGTTSPQAKLDVNGELRVTNLRVTNSGNGAVLLSLNSERSWEFQQFNAGSLTALKLKSVGGGGNKDFVIETDGKVGIGTVFPQSKLHVNGTTTTSVLKITGGADLSEQFEVNGSQEKEPGMVVCIDKATPGKLIVSTAAYDRTVAGVLSGAGGVQPGMLMGQNGTVAYGTNPVALTGRVYCWADASYGSIEPGDLLTTSNTPGHAMKVTDYPRAQGAILGKALSSLKSGTGLVLILVSLQ